MNRKQNTINRRMTNQKLVILEELKKLRTHPTADDLYAIVRQKLPNISLSTIYRNLIILAEDGHLRKLQFPGGQMRFDGAMAPHDHIKCKECGKVFDIDSIPVKHVSEMIGKITDFDDVAFSIELMGVCPECKRLKEQNAQGR